MSASDKMCSRNFNNDPKYLRSLVNNNVEILTSNGITHTGYVHVVDPVSESFIIVDNKSGKQDISIIFGHAIKSITPCGINTNNSELMSIDKLSDMSAENIEKKKTNIKSWLSKNLIHLEEDGLSLKLGDDLVIEPPYDKEHCFSGNAIILQRIQDILVKMPNNE